VWRHAVKGHVGDVGAPEELVAEISAFLTGSSVAFFDRRHRPIPPWAWLNRVAHASVADVEEQAGHLHDDEPSDDDARAVAVIAKALLTLSAGTSEQIESLQRSRLVPLELALLDGRIRPESSRDLTHVSLLALHIGRFPGYEPLGTDPGQCRSSPHRVNQSPLPHPVDGKAPGARA